MHQIRNKTYVLSLDDTTFLRTCPLSNEGRVERTNKLEEADQFPDAYQALEKCKKWYEQEGSNYELAPLLLNTRVEEIEIVRKIVKATEYPKPDAKPLRVLTEKQVRTNNMWGDPDYVAPNPNQAYGPRLSSVTTGKPFFNKRVKK